MTDEEVKDQAEVVEEPPEEGKSPARRVSWWITAAIGAAMLVVGLFLGYVGRGSLGPEAQAAKATQSAQTALLQTQQVTNKEIMDMLIKQTRHFKGSENAPVTLIEFSDFQ
jgi:hypothetical protein